MKKTLCSFAIMILGILPLTGSAQTSAVWPELKKFHSFMSSSFHPTEEGNFAPLKANADSLLIVAKLWKSSPIPAGYKPTETKTTLTKLVAQCQAIKNAVDTKQTNDQLKKLIVEAHDIFHTIVEKCRKEED